VTISQHLKALLTIALKIQGMVCTFSMTRQ